MCVFGNVKCKHNIFIYMEVKNKISNILYLNRVSFAVDSGTVLAESMETYLIHASYDFC